MSELKKASETFQPKSGLRNGYGHVRCPNSGCEHILFEASKRFWFTNRIEQMVCVQCDRPASLIACVQADTDAGELIARYWCHRCGDGFERAMIGIREYCKGCKSYQNVYFTLSMALPPIPPANAEIHPAS
jgi:hypothetical protein